MTRIGSFFCSHMARIIVIYLVLALLFSILLVWVGDDLVIWLGWR
jgi:hypothetical protein